MVCLIDLQGRRMKPVDVSPNNFAHYCIAYVLSVTAAALVSTFTLFRQGGFETATTNSLSTKSLHFLGVSLGILFLHWMVVFATFLIPFIVGMAISHWLRISHWGLFCCGWRPHRSWLEPYLGTPNQHDCRRGRYYLLGKYI